MMNAEFRRNFPTFSLDEGEDVIREQVMMTGTTRLFSCKRAYSCGITGSYLQGSCNVFPWIPVHRIYVSPWQLELVTSHLATHYVADKKASLLLWHAACILQSRLEVLRCFGRFL